MTCQGCLPVPGPTPAPQLPVGVIRLDEAARQYLGVRFRHQGRNPATGIDCVGLLVLSAAACGLSGLAEHDLTGYARDPHGGLLESRLRAAFGEPVPNMRPGDVVAMAFPHVVRHVGIVGAYPHGGLSLIHTYSNERQVIEHRLDERWLRLIRSAYRVSP